MGKNSAQSKPQTRNRYKGVRMRPSGKWSAEIRDPIEGRTWIGSYYTAEEACRAYDLHARRIGFPNAKLNFPDETPAPASQEGHPAKAENQEQPPQVSLENVQPNVNVVQQNSFNGFNSNPFDLDLPYDFVTANRNLEDTYYWSILHQEQNGPNALQRNNIVQEDSSNNLNNSVLDRDYLYSLIGSENIDLSVLGSAMEDGRNSTPAIPSVDSQPPEYYLPVGAGDLEESSGWSVFEMEMKNGPNTTNSNQKLKSNFIKAMPGAAEYDQRLREFDHPANGDASEFVVESERSLEKKIEKQKPERDTKDDGKMDKMKAHEGRMKMEDEELKREVYIEERKVDIEERNVFLEQKRIAVDQERIKLQRELKEIEIMMMDVSTMNEVQKKYVESLQNEIFSRRMAM